MAFQHQSIIENMDRVNVFRNICEYRSDSNRGLLDVIEDGYVCGNERWYTSDLRKERNDHNNN